MNDTPEVTKAECKKHEGIQVTLGLLETEIAKLDRLICDIKGTDLEETPTAEKPALFLGSFLAEGREIIEGYAKSVECAVTELRKLLF